MLETLRALDPWSARHGEPPYYSRDDQAQLAAIAAHDLQFPEESFGQVWARPNPDATQPCAPSAGIEPQNRSG